MNWLALFAIVVAWTSTTVIVVAFIHWGTIDDQPEPLRVEAYDPADTGRPDLHDSCPHCRAITPQILTTLDVGPHARSGQLCLICGLITIDTSHQVVLPE